MGIAIAWRRGDNLPTLHRLRELAGRGRRRGRRRGREPRGRAGGLTSPAPKASSGPGASGTADTRSRVSAVASSPDAPPGAGVRALRLVVVGGVLGVPAALLAAVFLAVVHELEHWLWTDLPHDLGTKTPPWYLVIGLPVVGAAVCVLARSLLPGDGGRSPLKGIAGGGPTPLKYAPGIALAALGTLSFGAVLGPEGPLIALGSVAGLAVATLAGAGQKESAVLAGAGSFAAIAALFGGPIVGGLMMVEGGVGLGAALIPTLIPGFVAAASGYVLFIGLGSWGGLSSQAITVPGLPLYQGTHVLDLLVGIGVGVAAGLVVSFVRRYAGAVEVHGPEAAEHAGDAAARWTRRRAARPDRAVARGELAGRAVLGPVRDPRPDRPDLDQDRADPAGGEGDRLFDQHGVRLPWRAGVPGDLPRRRAGHAVRGLVRNLADARGRRRHRRRHDRDDPADADSDRVLGAARRAQRRGHGLGRGACVRGGVADGGGAGPAGWRPVGGA